MPADASHQTKRMGRRKKDVKTTKIPTVHELCADKTNICAKDEHVKWESNAAKDAQGK